MVVFSSPVISRMPFPSVNSMIAPTHFLPVCPVVAPPVCFVLAVPVVEQRYGTESIWHSIFREHSSRLPHKWNLVQVASKPPGNWYTFVDSAKVRFCCEACGHGWTSMKGRVTFWCSFFNNSGVVAFRLYGQQCERCREESYESPAWYPEEIQKVIGNMCHRIAHLFYGSEKPAIRLKRRPGKPKTPHNSEKCQACKDGVCALRR